MALRKITFFGPKILGKKDPQNQMWTFYAPIGTHQVRKFGAITPTDADDISQSTPDFLAIFRILGVKNQLEADPSPVRCVLASVGHLPSMNCEIFRGKAS